MKRMWELDELIEHFTLLPGERDLLANKTGATRLGFAILLKYFEYEGRFPESAGEIPRPVVSFLAKQLDQPAEAFEEYDWQGRAVKYHRAQIREAFGFHETTVADARAMSAWLCDEVIPHGQVYEQVLAAAYGRCRACRLVPPTPARMERLVRSALRTFEDRFCANLMTQLAPDTRARLDELLVTDDQEAHAERSERSERSDAPDKGSWSLLADLKADPGRPGLASVLDEVAKLERLRALALPAAVFRRLPAKLLQAYRQRVSAEPPRELRRHPAAIRYTLLAAYCWMRQQEITDQLVDLLIAIVQSIGARAERKIERQVLADVRQVTGKATILYQLAEAAVDHPYGIIKAVLYPLVGEQTLRDLVREYKASGPAYRRQVQTTMRASYSHHYRQMMPYLLRLLEFRSNNEVHRLVLRALTLIKAYAGRTEHHFAPSEQVPLDSVVRPGWRDLVVKTDARGREQVNRIAYEICVLEALREQLRCKEVWVVGADRYRNPDDDLPADFERRRETYYAALKLPTDADTFIDDLKAQMREALTLFDQSLRRNQDPAVRLTTRHGRGWIALSPLTPQPEPVNLGHLKGEVGRRWPMTTVLDYLKETDLRVGFTTCFTSTAAREALERDVLQKRLLLCLHGLGTNTGLKRASVGTDGETYADLLYVRRRFIQKEHLRAAIARVANAVFAIRQRDIWGEGTTACASDSKQFGAFDQNLMTQWHLRYGGRGVMVYWHVERKSVCIYSQLKTVSSSEVAAMIEGVLRHCTDMTVARQYVDSHGQSEVAFAFCHLLGFQLLPRLKAMGTQKLYRPAAGSPEAYPQLQTILTRPINWDLIRQQYDELVKYATALRLGTAESEAILRRFTRSNLHHPAYRALAELGKALKTIFLCQYLTSQALRREIQEGLNVIESWNAANLFLFYGRSGEIATNRKDDQEVALLALHLLQVSLVYINTLMLQKVLAEPAWRDRLSARDYQALTPLLYHHVNPYGIFPLDMTTRLDLDVERQAS